MINYSLILETKYKDSLWSINNDSYEELIWYSETPKPTKLELDSQWNEVLEITKKQNCKDEAKRKISDCDWSVLPDVNLLNKSDFESYRLVLRNLILNPVENPVFPTEPNPVWATQPEIGDNNG